MSDTFNHEADAWESYAATLPPEVTYLPTKDGGHNSREDNEAFRRTFDATNARYRASCSLAYYDNDTGLPK